MAVVTGAFVMTMYMLALGRHLYDWLWPKKTPGKSTKDQAPTVPGKTSSTERLPPSYEEAGKTSQFNFIV